MLKETRKTERTFEQLRGSLEMASPIIEISNSDDVEGKKLLNRWLSSNFVLKGSVDLIFEQQVAEAREETKITSIGHGFCAEVSIFPIVHC